MKKSPVHILLGTGLAVLFAYTTQAQADLDTASRYASNIWAFTDDKPVLTAAVEITTKKFPDCDEATVERRMVQVYRPDGTGEMQDESFVKVLTEKGMRDNRTIKLSFMLPYSKVEVVKLEVRKPDGAVINVNLEENSKETINNSQMASNIYDPNFRSLQVNIPHLEIGDVVHSVTRETILRSIIPGEFADENVFEDKGYIRHLSYEIFSPAQRPLKSMVLRDEIPGTIKYSTQTGEGNTVIHRWKVDNVPRMFPEPFMPPYEMVLQRLLVSTIPDWPAVSRWYWELSRSHLDATNREMERTVSELTTGVKTELEKIKAVFYYVSKKIRYMGLTPEKDRPGFEPHDVGITFEKKYGVCRDKAALLVAMLRLAGLNSYPVLINIGSKMDPEVADPFFNHAIVCVELKPGEYTLMDPTDENTRDLLPSYDCDQSYLVCRPEGANLKISPVQPPEDNMMLVKTAGTLSAEGWLDAKSELSFGGVNDDEYRNRFSNLKSDDIRRFFEGAIKQTLPSARLKSIKLTPEDMSDVSAPLGVELEYSAGGLTATGGGKAVVAVPWLGKHLGMLNFILSGAGLEKRKYPMQTYFTCGLRENISLKLADDFTAAMSMPACLPVGDECLNYRCDFTFAKGMLNCSREAKLKTVEFTPSQYLKLKQTLKTLDFDERKTPIMAIANKPMIRFQANANALATTAIESDAEILNVEKELAVADEHTAVYKVKYSKRILNYAGKERESEVKIHFNPSTQAARLIRGVVVSKAGRRQEISGGEMNFMDAWWNASAQRYTGDKILVANLPGVEVGSTIEVEYEITSKGIPYLSGFESFQLPDELDAKSFRLSAPLNIQIMKMVSGATSFIQEDGKRDNRQQTFEWRAKHVQALPAESQLPPQWVYNAGVSYFVGDMKSYLKDLKDILFDRSLKRSKTEALVHQLTRGSKTGRDTAKAIRDFVAQSIRVAGPVFTDLPLAELSAADSTLKDGYGHRADCAILLYAMLTDAGFHPEFVLASTLPSIDTLNKVSETFPSPDIFEIPLVRITLNGESCYLNDGDQYSELGSTTHDGHLGLALSSQSYEVIRSAKNCSDKTETEYRLSMTDIGKARLNVVRHYYGESYNAKNKFFSELPPEEKRRYYQEMVSGIAQGARPESDLTTRFDAYPGLEQFAVEIDNYSVVDGPYQYFDLPFTPSLLPVDADRRMLPLLISKASQNIIRTKIELPKGFPHMIIAPKNEQLDEPDHGGKARITVMESPGTCVITEEFETAPAIVYPQDYPAMLKIESELGRKAAKAFLLERN